MRAVAPGWLLFLVLGYILNSNIEHQLFLLLLLHHLFLEDGFFQFLMTMMMMMEVEKEEEIEKEAIDQKYELVDGPQKSNGSWQCSEWKCRC